VEREGRSRLFPGYDEKDLHPLPAAPFLIGRLLEDGDGADLRWLFRTLPADAVTAWFERLGGRQLSARSRAFWEVILGRPAGPTAAGAAALWPL